MNIAEQLSAHLGNTFQAPGAEIRFNCPQCDRAGKTPDTKGHLYINTRKEVYFCQRCEWKGSVKWLFQHLGIRTTPTVQSWADTIRRLRLITGEDYREAYDPAEEIEYPCGTIEPELGYRAYTYLTASKDREVNGLACRGLHPTVIDEYRIRIGASGTFWEQRIFVPTWWDDLLTFWVARDLTGTHPVKYLNPYGRSRRYHVFNLDKALQYRDVVITEGVFSAIAAGPNAVASFGKYVTAEQLIQLAEAGFETYYVALDGDAKPQALYVASWLKRRGKHVKIVALPAWGDPDSVEDFPQRLREAPTFGFRTRLEFTMNRFE